MLLRLSCSSPEEREGKRGRRERRGKERGKEGGSIANYDLHTWQTVPSLLSSSPSLPYQKSSENVGRHYTPHPSSSLPFYSILLLLLYLPPTIIPPPPIPPPLTSNALNMFADTPLATSYSPCSLGFRSIIEQNILRQKQQHMFNDV